MLRRLTLSALLLLTMLPAAALAQDQRCFAETGYCIGGRIREFWEQSGGLPVFGFPTGPQGQELIEGRPYQVQRFERNRLELHPENARPYDVLLGRLGVDRLAQQNRPDWQAFRVNGPNGECRGFATAHSVCGPFLKAWRASGLEFDGQPGTSENESLALFGLPISSPAYEVIEGKPYLVQWFERARFELHPENPAPYDVLLGLLGNEIRLDPPLVHVSASAEIDGLTVAGGRVFFSARDAEHGLELWASDGTTAGTRLVKDILPGPELGWPRHIASLGNVVLFAARAKADAADTLWRSDGSEAGTTELLPAGALHDPWLLTTAGARIFLIATDDAHGQELWVTDGTPGGTKLVKDVYPGARGIDAAQNKPMGYLQFTPTAVGTLVYFQAEAPGQGYGIWKTDGSEAGTQFVSHLGQADGSAEFWDMTALGDALLFVGRTGRLNYGLYRSDGTAAGTRLVRDFSYTSDPGNIRLYPPLGNLRAIGNRVYFDYGGQLWSSDGTTAGTAAVSELSASEVAAVGQRVFTLAHTQPGGLDLLQAGVASNPIVTTIAPTLSLPAGKLAAAGGRLFIGVNGDKGRAELWVSDGTPGGTRPLVALRGKLFGQNDLADGQRTWAALGDQLLFVADDGQHGGELWASDGTPGGTLMLRDIELRQ